MPVCDGPEGCLVPFMRIPYQERGVRASSGAGSCPESGGSRGLAGADPGPACYRMSHSVSPAPGEAGQEARAMIPSTCCDRVTKWPRPTCSTPMVPLRWVQQSVHRRWPSFLGESVVDPRAPALISSPRKPTRASPLRRSDCLIVPGDDLLESLRQNARVGTHFRVDLKLLQCTSCHPICDPLSVETELRMHRRHDRHEQ